jgi:hypothetical protein
LEKEFELLENFSRVTPSQRQYIKVKENSRYKPVKNVMQH